MYKRLDVLLCTLHNLKKYSCRVNQFAYGNKLVFRFFIQTCQNFSVSVPLLSYFIHDSYAHRYLVNFEINGA